MPGEQRTGSGGELLGGRWGVSGAGCRMRKGEVA